MKHSFLDEYSNRDSFLHRRDPRIKIMLMVIFILFVISTTPESFRTFALYGVAIGGLIILSEIPPRYILKKSAAIVPFVFFIALFMPFLKTGITVFSLSLGPFTVRLTHTGLLSSWNVLIKSYLCILCMILLTNTTPFADLLKGFEKLKVPALFIMIVSFMYRYVFVLEDELEKMLLAKQSRSLKAGYLFEIKTRGNMVGVLFIRSYERAEAVYTAMCCRGYTGQIQTLHDFRITKKDMYLLVAAIILLTHVRLTGA